MSATRDKSQNFTFVYSNLYQLYKKGHEAAKAADLSSLDEKNTNSVSDIVTESPTHVAITKSGLVTAKVIKAEDLNQGALSSIRVTKPVFPSLLGKRIEVKTDSQAPLVTDIIKSIPPEGPEALLRRTPVVKTALRTLVQKPDTVKAQALDSLKQNLKNLNDLHARLRFMLKELEELVKE